jgi:Stress responsive A/B Barrel Domain
VSLLHLVSFKYKADAGAAAQEDHRARLAALKDIDGIASLKVGADVVRSPRSYDTGLAITCTDRAALDAYQKNPRHVPVAQFGVSLCEHIVAVDFDI